MSEQNKWDAENVNLWIALQKCLSLLERAMPYVPCKDLTTVRMHDDYAFVQQFASQLAKAQTPA